jgi:hypothetical protein
VRKDQLQRRRSIQCELERRSDRAKARRHHRSKTKTDGTIKLTGHAGIDTISFQGRLSKSHKLKPGTYTLSITASNSSG